MKTVLSVDGGGIRGIVPLVILKFIQNNFLNKQDLLTYFDCGIGTSTGSIIVASLFKSNPTKIDYLIDLYCNKGNIIFKHRTRQLIANKISFRNNGKENSLNTLLRFKHSKYKSDGFKLLLTELFKNDTIRQFVKPCYIVSFCTTKNSKLIFGTSNLSDLNKLGFLSDDLATIKISDAVLASCSAPTYFPPAKIKIGSTFHQFFDGGIVANNPSFEILKKLNESLRIPIKDIKILSLGTGLIENEKFPFDKSGIIHLIKPTLDVALFNASENVHQYMQFLNDNKKFKYLRINPVLNQEFKDFDFVQSKKISSLYLTVQKLIEKDFVLLNAISSFLNS